jgi:protein-tyrosine phosphatase
MIDIHSHILHSIDDGSDGLDKSLAQLRIMDAGGVKRVYLSSHYFRGHYQYERHEYDQKLETLRQAAHDEGLGIELQSGFEVFVQPGIVEDIKSKSLFLGESSYVLIESELNGLPEDFYTNVYPLLRSGYKPILAHAERYVSIMRKPSTARDLIEKNIYVQTNAGSLLGYYGEKVRKTAWILIENGWTHILASDDHVRGDYEAMFRAKKMIQDRIDDKAANLLTREHPAMIQSSEKIPYNYVSVKYIPHRRKSFLRRIFA